MNVLPQKPWAFVCLGQIAEFVRGVTYKPADVTVAEDPTAIACMRTKNIQVDLEDDDLVFIPRSPIKANKLLRAGDILVSSANSWNLVGKCCWVPGLPYQATFGGFTSVLRVDPERASPRYVYHWFSMDRTQQLARSFGQQTTNISNLNQSRCLELEIPLPPLDEQRRISAIMDKADALRRKRKRAIELTDALTESTFDELFGHLIAHAREGAHIRALGEVAEIASGITKGRKLNGEATREVPYLAVANVQDKFLDLRVVKTIEATESEIRRYLLKRNDLLLTEGGDPDKLGRGTLWANELKESIHQNHIFRVRVTSSAVLPMYLIWLLGSVYGKAYFLRSAKQTTGIASINKTQLSEFPVIIPPKDLQIDFEKKVRLIARVSKDGDTAGARIDELFSSLQHRAFSGQL